MKFATRLKFTAVGSNASTITVAGSVTGCRTLAQVISDGVSDSTAIKVGDSGVPFVVDDGNGNWEDSLFTITSNTVITRESVVSSSAGGTTVPTYTGATLTVFNTVPGSWLRKVVINSDGVAATDLTALTPTGTQADTYLVPMIDPATGVGYKVTVAALKALFGASATPTVTSVTVSPSTASLAGLGTQTFTASVVGTNSPAQTVTWSASAGSITSGGVFTAPAATSSSQTITITATSTVDTSKSGTATVTVAANTSTVTGVTVSPSTVNMSGSGNQTFTAVVAGTNSPAQTVTWSTSAGNITSGGVFTAPAATASAQTITITATSTQDATKSGTATVTVAAGTETITVNTPSSPQVVGTAFTVSGTWTITQPTALDYRLSDDAAGVWTQITATINANGTYSFSVTPSTSSTGRTISVRDRNNTSASGTSGSYTVSAAATMASQYNLTATNSSSMTGGSLTMTAASPDYYAAPATQRVNIRSNDGQNRVPADGTFKWVWLKKGVTPSAAGYSFSSTQLNADTGNTANGNQVAHGNGVLASFVKVGGWTDSTSQYYGSYSPNGSFYIWGDAPPDTYCLWVMFNDGSNKIYDNNTGVGIEYACS